MTGTVFMEDMTWPEVRDAIAAGTVRVIVIVAAMEQHGPHLAESTDTHLGYAIAGRLARRLGGTLVAPAITLGFSEMNMSLAGTVSLRASTLEAVLFDVCESLSRHGFQEIILLNAHGGNYPVLRDVLPRLEMPTLRCGSWRRYGRMPSGQSGSHCERESMSPVWAPTLDRRKRP